MSRDPVNTAIGEYTVTASVLPPRDAVAVQLKLVKLLGPALFQGLGSKGMSKEEVGGLLMTALSSGIDEAEVFKLVEMLLSVARINGNKVTLDSQEFYGDPLLLWQTAGHVLVTNFKNFATAARTRFGHLLAKAPQSSQSNSPT